MKFLNVSVNRTVFYFTFSHFSTPANLVISYFHFVVTESRGQTHKMKVRKMNEPTQITESTAQEKEI